MSRPARAGSASKPVTIRAVAEERAAWERAARNHESLSAWIVATLNRAARRAARSRR